MSVWTPGIRARVSLNSVPLRSLQRYVQDAQRNVLTVASIGHVAGETVVDIGLIARVVDGRVVIDRDVNNKPLVDALLQAGVPRRQIVLAYAGETVSDAA